MIHKSFSMYCCTYNNYLFIYYSFFFKEILVQDHFFRKYSLHHSIFELDYLCLPPLMMNWLFYYKINHIRARRGWAWGFKINNFVIIVIQSYYTPFWTLFIVVFRWSRLMFSIGNCLPKVSAFIKHFHPTIREFFMATFLRSPKRSLFMFILELKLY